jgi:hypothetical protein
VASASGRSRSSRWVSAPGVTELTIGARRYGEFSPESARSRWNPAPAQAVSRVPGSEGFNRAEPDAARFADDRHAVACGG